MNNSWIRSLQGNPQIIDYYWLFPSYKERLRRFKIIFLPLNKVGI